MLDNFEKPHYMRYVPECVDDSSKKYCIRLSTKGLDIPNFENIKHLLVFQTSTFKKLEVNGNDPIIWESLFGIINMFFNTLSKDDQTTLTTHMVLLHSSINEFIQTEHMEKFSDFINQKSVEVSDNNNAMDLCGKLYKFVEKTIHIKDDPDIGTGAQHTEELTFEKHQVLLVLTITLLCKLYSPISGIIMTNIKGPIDCKLKEMHASALFKILLSEHYQTLTDKMWFYIKNQINKIFKETYSTIFFAWTPNKLADYIFASLLVRNFINIDLLNRDSNIMVYMVVTCKKIIESKYREASKSPVQQRVQFASVIGDDSNIAQMELDSVTSYKTCDVVPIINSYITKCCTRYRISYDIDNDVYNQCLKYYTYNKVRPTHFNKFLACGIFGHDIGGGKGILMLHQKEYTQLMTILTLLCFNYGYYKLGCMVSAGISDKIKIVNTPADNMMTLNYASSFAYSNCKNVYDKTCAGSNNKDWDKSMLKLVEHLTKTNYVYNTAPISWDKINIENANGKIIENNHDLISELCGLIDSLVIQSID